MWFLGGVLKAFVNRNWYLNSGTCTCISRPSPGAYTHYPNALCMDKYEALVLQAILIKYLTVGATLLERTPIYYGIRMFHHIMQTDDPVH